MIKAVENKICNLKQTKIKEGTICGEKGTRVSELLQNEWEQWQKGDKILLSAPMGSGKSYFIYNHLVKNSFRKRILILSNRSKLRKQYDSKLEEHKQDVMINEIFGTPIYGAEVDIMTYQSLEGKLKKNEPIDHYNYIICDEAHYFITDSWNESTDMSFKWVNTQHNSIVIYMSATGEEVFNLFDLANVNTKNYYIEPDYSRFDMYYYECDGVSMVEYLLAKEDIDENNKIIYFANNKEKAVDLYDQYKHMASITVSESDKTIENTENAIENEKCNYTLTIATTCIDNGIDIFDETVKYIVCDVFDQVQAIQCMGRKRFTDTEQGNVKVFMKNWYGKGLQGMINFAQRDVDLVNGHLDRIAEGKISRSSNLPRGLYFDFAEGKVKSNPLYYRYINQKLDNVKKFQENVEIITDMCTTPICNEYDGELVWSEEIEYMDKGYCSTYIYFMQSRLQKSEYSTIDVKTLTLEENISNALSKMVGKQFIGKEGRTEIAQVVGVRDKQRHLLTTVKSMNIYLEENNISYMIAESRKTIQGKKKTIYEVVEN